MYAAFIITIGLHKHSGKHHYVQRPHYSHSEIIICMLQREVLGQVTVLPLVKIRPSLKKSLLGVTLPVVI